MSHALHKLEHEGFQTGRGGQQHRTVGARADQLPVHVLGQGGVAVESEDIHGLGHDRGEPRPQDTPRKFEQGLGDYLDDQRVTITEHERQQGTHHGGFTSPHDHLVAQGFVGFGLAYELVDQLHLGFVRLWVDCILFVVVVFWLLCGGVR